MKHGKMKKKNDPVKEDIFALPNQLANLMRDITLLFSNNLVIFCGHI
jgi:hypothetical protein